MVVDMDGEIEAVNLSLLSREVEVKGNGPSVKARRTATVGRILDENEMEEASSWLPM